MPHTPPQLRQVYNQFLQKNDFKPHANQLTVITILQHLIDQLQQSSRRSFLQKLKMRSTTEQNTPDGVFIWGNIGSGKTFVMDLFYRSLSGVKKQRMHFYRFMEEVHKQLKSFHDQTNPMEKVARYFAQQAKVLCIDEFHITNIADAMIMHQFLKHLFAQNAILVATSNSAPKDLYKGGLQYERFVPAIDLLEKHTCVVALSTEQDYRAQYMRKAGTYFHPHTEQTQQLLQSRFFPNISATTQSIEVNGRDIPVINESIDSVWFDFRALCDGPRSVKDYIEIANMYATIIVSNIPVFNNTDHSARRFIHLVDELYDRDVHLVVSAATNIDHLYQKGNLSVMFQRTQSRLREMQSKDYLHHAHHVV